MDKRRRTNKRGIGNALGVLDLHAGNLSETSRALSIPISTVKTWRDRYENDPIVAKYRNLKNEELAERFRVVSALAIERLHSEIALVKVDNLMTMAATGADKQLLLTGQPTAITRAMDGLINKLKADMPDVNEAEIRAYLTDEAVITEAIN